MGFGATDSEPSIRNCFVPSSTVVISLATASKYEVSVGIHYYNRAFADNPVGDLRDLLTGFGNGARCFDLLIFSLSLGLSSSTGGSFSIPGGTVLCITVAAVYSICLPSDFLSVDWSTADWLIDAYWLSSKLSCWACPVVSMISALCSSGFWD